MRTRPQESTDALLGRSTNDSPWSKWTRADAIHLLRALGESLLFAAVMYAMLWVGLAAGL